MTETEVDETDVIVLIEDDVFEFDIAMGNFDVIVKVIEGGYELTDDAFDCCFREAVPSGHTIAQCSVVAVFHYEIVVHGVFEEVVKGDDEGMIEFFHEEKFPFKSVAGDSIAWNDFDCDLGFGWFV